MEKVEDIKRMVDDYLNDNHMPSISELRNGDMGPEGELDSYYKVVIQQLVAAKAKQNGLNINDIINQSHGTTDKKQVLGVMTKAEMDYALGMVDEYLAIKAVEAETLEAASVSRMAA